MGGLPLPTGEPMAYGWACACLPGGLCVGLCLPVLALVACTRLVVGLPVSGGLVACLVAACLCLVVACALVARPMGRCVTR